MSPNSTNLPLWLPVSALVWGCLLEGRTLRGVFFPGVLWGAIPQPLEAGRGCVLERMKSCLSRGLSRFAPQRGCRTNSGHLALQGPSGLAASVEASHRAWTVAGCSV